MFDDTIREGFDEVSKLIEPMVWSENEKLMAFPESYELTYDYLARTCKYNGSSVETSDLICKIIEEKELPSFKQVDKCFTISMLDELDLEVEELDIDFETGKLNGRIFLKKTKNSYTDEEMHEYMCNNIRQSLRSMLDKPRYFEKKYLNEIAEIFDIPGVGSERSAGGKRHKFVAPFIDKIKDFTFNIRDVDLGLRMAWWIRAYVRRGNLAAVKNLCILKAMTLSKKGIYSIEGEEAI